MCGIAGVSDFTGRPIDRSALERALAQLRHRGPDGQGLWLDATRCHALAHARLAIIDVAGGAQPIANEANDLQVIFNGEIYNHVELRRELEKAGHRFRTASDTEVLVHLYEDRGMRMLDALVGMFAFALWDSRLRTLVLARDRMGQKPLFFAVRPGRLSFASELKGLWPLLGETPTLDPTAIDHYLSFQYVPGHCCAFRGVQKLAPGEWATWSAEGLRRGKYWTPPTPIPTFRGTFSDAAAELRFLLRDATRGQLRSDVPVGALLSGGVDSAAIVGLMSEAGAGTIRTYTVHFAPHGADERPFARAVANRFGTRHEEWVVPAPAPDTLAHVLDFYDEPFADTSAVPMSQICQLASGAIKVALTGDGGDELFVGYDRYFRYHRHLSQMAWMRPLTRCSGLRRISLRLCPEPGPRTWRRRLRAFATLWDDEPGAAYARWLFAFSEFQKRRLRTETYDKVRGSGPTSEELVSQGLLRSYSGDWVAAAAAYDLATYLPDAVLAKADRASMAHGLELRSPFLDHRVVEFLATVPRAWKWSPRGGAKRLLRSACADLLPAEVQNRGKQGFGAPVGQWLKGELGKELSSRKAWTGVLADWLKRDVVETLLQEHQTGAENHSYRLWTLLSLQRVARRLG